MQDGARRPQQEEFHSIISHAMDHGAISEGKQHAHISQLLYIARFAQSDLHEVSQVQTFTPQSLP